MIRHIPQIFQLDAQMAGYVSCPNCEQPVDPQARTCKHCGVDLAVAAAVAESNVRLPEPLGEGVVMTPEILVPRLGDYLLKMGLVKIEDLERALAYQRDMAQQGKGDRCCASWTWWMTRRWTR
jgi:hypothetical protein